MHIRAVSRKNIPLSGCLHRTSLSGHRACYYQIIMALDSFLGRAGKRRDEVAHHAVPESGPSLGTIHDEPEFKVFMGTRLNPTNTALWDRYTKGVMRASDRPVIERQREVYLERKKNGEQLVGLITDYSRDLVRNSDAFRLLTQTYGAERVDAIVQQGLKELAIKDPTGFARIQARFTALSDFREREERPVDTRIKEWCTKHHIGESQALRDAMLAPTQEERVALLRKQFTQGMPRMRRALDFCKSAIGFGSYAKAAEIANVDVAALLAQKEQLTHDAGDFLQTLLVNTKEYREALNRAQVGLEPTLKDGAGSLTSFEHVRDFEYNVPEIKQQWKEFLKQQKVRGWSRLSAARQDALHDAFWNGAAGTPTTPAWRGYRDRARPKGAGFFAALWGALFGIRDYENVPEVKAALA
jgi:hypothetical protein